MLRKIEIEKGCWYNIGEGKLHLDGRNLRGKRRAA